MRFVIGNAGRISADGVFVGGGNSFRLLKRLYETGLVEGIRQVVRRGDPYMGASAGSNVACPTIKTTNDMPIVEPPTLEGLGLIRFQMNPHYVDRDPDVPHGGETREQRIAEFHEENTAPVIGLREGSWLLVGADGVTLAGVKTARLFLIGEPPVELDPGPIALELLKVPPPPAGPPSYVIRSVQGRARAQSTIYKRGKE